jgi:ABC-type sugar transport system substrate-binding protein
MSTLRFVVSLMMEDNPYQQEQATAAQEAAAQCGVEVQVFFNHDGLMQGQRLLEMIQSKERAPDGIICQPVGTVMTQVAEEATRRGIGWVLLNRHGEYIFDLRRRMPGAVVFGIGIDQEEIGKIQGRQLTKLLPEGGLVLCITGPTANPIIKQRIAGMNSTKPANIQLRMIHGQFTEQSGYQAVKSWLELSTSRSTPIVAVAAQNDSMAFGAYRALQEGLTKEEWSRWSRLPFIGCDACRGLVDRRLRASIYLPVTAALAVKALAAAILHEQGANEWQQLVPVSLPALHELRAPAKASAKSAL